MDATMDGSETTAEVEAEIEAVRTEEGVGERDGANLQGVVAISEEQHVAEIGSHYTACTSNGQETSDPAKIYPKVSSDHTQGTDRSGEPVVTVDMQKAHETLEVDQSSIEESNSTLQVDPPLLSSEADLNVIAHQAASTPNVEECISPREELDRLRKLVFASRGTKSQLPKGWEDQERKEYADVNQTRTDNYEQAEEEVLITRAVAKVGDTTTDTSEDDSDGEDSSSSSSSSSSESESELTAKRNRRPNQQQQPIVAYGSDDDEDEEGGKGGSARGPTTKNEVIEPTVDAPPYSVVPAEKDIRPLGKVHSIIDSVVVVSQDTGKAPGAVSQYYNGAVVPVDSQGRRGEQAGEYSVLDTGSLLTFEDRNVLGVVYETFGSVLEPLYALRFATAEQINAEMIYVGKAVYYVPADSTYVLTRALRAMAKGSDASNVWDEEVGDDERDFSDDEAEAEYKRSVKAAKRQDGSTMATNGNQAAVGAKSARRQKGGTVGVGGTNNASFTSGAWQPQAGYSHVSPAYGSIMHPDVDLGITRSAPLPYDDDAATSSYGNPRYTPYQNARPRGGIVGSTAYAGQARGRGRGYGAQQPVNAHMPIAAANPHFAQQAMYGQQPPYGTFLQQQAFGAPSMSAVWTNYQTGVDSTSAAQIAYTYATDQAQAPTPNANQATYGYASASQNGQRYDERNTYDPSQPRY
jgi:hypothetical protein